jgi:hypothetical protein
MKLVKSRVKKLIAALRSGKYQQTRGTLRQRTNGQTQYCCLGVACDIYRKETRKGKWKKLDSQFDFYHDAETVSEGVLTKPVAEWYGFNGLNPLVNNKMATVRNDSEKQTFAEIADALEIDLNKS